MGEQSWSVSATLRVVSGADSRLLTHATVGVPPYSDTGIALKSLQYSMAEPLFIGVEAASSQPLEAMDSFAAYPRLLSQVQTSGCLQVLAESMTGEDEYFERPATAQAVDTDGLWMVWPAWRIQLLRPAQGSISLSGSIDWSFSLERIVRVMNFQIDIHVTPSFGQASDRRS